MSPLSKNQRLLAGLIFLTIIFFSLFHLTESPGFSFDEGWAVQVAANISRVGIDGLQFSPGNIQHVSVLTSFGYPLSYTLALWFKLFGVGLLQARLLMVAFMIGLSVAVFALVRRLFGNMFALSSLAILSTFPPFYSFGKNIIGEMPVFLFLTLFLLFFNFAVNNPERRRFWFMMAGASIGLCVATKTMALAFIPVLVIGAVMAMKRGVATWKDVITVAVCAIVPIAVWTFVNFQRGDTLASVMDYYSNPAAIQDRAASMLHNFRMLYTTFSGLFTLTLLFVWVAGVAVRLKARITIAIEEWMTLIFSWLLIFAFLRMFGDARYLFPIEFLGILFAPYSIYLLWVKVPLKWGATKKPAVYVCAISAFCLAGLYQVSFHSYVAQAYSSHIDRDLSAYFSAIPDSTSILFYNSTNVAALFHGSNYYQRIRMFDKWILGSELSPMIPKGQVDMLVINSARIKEDADVSLSKYEKVADFGQIAVYKKIGLKL